MAGWEYNPIIFQDKVDDNPDDVEKLVKYALKVVGFKPIEQRDIDRIKRIESIDVEIQWYRF